MIFPLFDNCIMILLSLLTAFQTGWMREGMYSALLGSAGDLVKEKPANKSQA